MSDKHTIASLPRGVKTDTPGYAEMFEANARLIAAAPDMLDMLQRLHKAGGIWPDLLPALQSVIAKATGRLP